MTAGFVTGACDRTPAIIMSQSEPLTPRPVRLPADVRTRLDGRFDIEAMEELLASMPPAEQQQFLISIGGVPRPAGEETRDVTVLMGSTDPARQKLIDRMWAPYWDHLPPEFLERTDLPFPGRELARARRAARVSEHENGTP